MPRLRREHRRLTPNVGHDNHMKILTYITAVLLTPLTGCIAAPLQTGSGASSRTGALENNIYGVMDTNTLMMTGVFIRSDGVKYFGSATADGKFQGLGTMICDKFVYHGEWSNSYWNGNGMVQWNDGSIYVGTFKNGEATGGGKIWYPNGNIYSGEVTNAYMNGKGIYYWDALSLAAQGEFRGNVMIKTNSVISTTNKPNHGLESTSAPPAAGTLETHP